MSLSGPDGVHAHVTIIRVRFQIERAIFLYMLRRVFFLICGTITLTFPSIILTWATMRNNGFFLLSFRGILLSSDERNVIGYECDMPCLSSGFGTLGQWFFYNLLYSIVTAPVPIVVAFVSLRTARGGVHGLKGRVPPILSRVNISNMFHTTSFLNGTRLL